MVRTKTLGKCAKISSLSTIKMPERSQLYFLLLTLNISLLAEELHPNILCVGSSEIAYLKDGIPH